MSAAPPGVDGAMMRIGRVGQSAADAANRLDADDTRHKRDSKTLHLVLDGVLLLGRARRG